MDIQEFLTKKYFEWEMEQGHLGNQTKFARWLGVKQQSLSNWMRGDYKPRKLEDISKLGDKLGYEVYNILGLTKPLPPEIEEPLALFVESLRMFPQEARGKITVAMVDTVEEVIRLKNSDDERWVSKRFLENVLRRLEEPADSADVEVVDDRTYGVP